MPGRRGHLSSKMNLLCLSYDEVAFTTLLRVLARARTRRSFSRLDEKKSAPAGSSIHPHVKTTEWDRSMNRINPEKKKYLIAWMKHLIFNKTTFLTWFRTAWHSYVLGPKITSDNTFLTKAGEKKEGIVWNQFRNVYAKLYIVLYQIKISGKNADA